MNNAQQQIPRQVTQHHKSREGFNTPENTDVIAKANIHTWSTRYQAIMSEEGYNTGRHVIRATPFKEWLALTQVTPTTWFIEARFLYYSLLDSMLFLDFTKLFADFINQPINYFSMYNSTADGEFNAHRLFTLLQNQGYYLVSKEAPQKINPRQMANWSVEQIIRAVEDRVNANTIIPEMLVRMLELAWDDEIRPEMNHALIFSQNPQLIPVIRQLKKMQITTSLAIAPNRNMSNYYLRQFDHVVDMHAIFRECNALTTRI